jgi:predicted phosphodiesterase
MKIKLVSDLHLEFSDVMIPNDANYDLLILSGDILVAQDLHDFPEENVRTAAMLEMLSSRQAKAQRFRDFFKRCSFQFPHVIYVAGNHEFYHGKFFASIDHLREECAKYPNIYFLENDTKIIQDRNHETGEVSDIVFMGATLWTDCNKHDPFTLHALADMMNDFRIIRNDQAGYRSLKPADIADRHRKTLQYFRTVMDGYPQEQKFVVVGHHTPSHASCHPQYAHDYIMNGGYHSDLSEFILDHPQIKLWTHGHTHHPFDYVLGSTRIVCNPRGYESDGYTEDTGWNPNIVLEV